MLVGRSASGVASIRREAERRGDRSGGNWSRTEGYRVEGR